jgi:AcrR family transcriptional regulator
MSRGRSGTRTHILDVVVKMLTEKGRGDIRVVDIAEAANVAQQTIYYHFESVAQLISEAQESDYLRMVEPLHGFLLLAENAMANDDEAAFWNAIGDDVMLAWTYGFGEDNKWKIPKLLIDIWADAKTQKEFSRQLDLQLERWVRVIEAAKARGWADPNLDTYALIASCWGASHGQSLFSGTSVIQYTPQTIRDFWIGVARMKR